MAEFEVFPVVIPGFIVFDRVAILRENVEQASIDNNEGGVRVLFRSEVDLFAFLNQTVGWDKGTKSL